MKRRLCVVMPAHWEAYMGGAEYQAKCLVEALASRGRYEVFFLGRRIDPAFRPEGYEIIQVGENRGLSRYSYLFDAPALLRALERVRPDAIYQRVACAYTGITAYYASRNNCRLVWHVAHDTDVTPHDLCTLQNPVSRYLEKLAIGYGLRKADGIVTQTQRQADLLKQYYRRDCRSVIPNFHPSATESLDKPHPIKVVWIANLKPWKQPEVFVSLAKELAGMRNVRFVMIGAPPQRDQPWYQELREKISACDNLDYLGARSQAEVNGILAGAHVFVNTSLHEGFPNTFIQSWMRRVPVVSLHVNPDGMFDSREIGLFSQNQKQLATDVRLLIENDSLREEMAGKAQEYAYVNHGIKGNVERLIHLLDEEPEGKPS